MKKGNIYLVSILIISLLFSSCGTPQSESDQATEALSTAEAQIEDMHNQLEQVRSEIEELRGQPDQLCDERALELEMARAFSLVGRWNITRMNVRIRLIGYEPTVPGASLASITEDIHSSLGTFGYFEVQPDGNVVGEGQAQYGFRLAAGTTAFFTPFSVNPIPIGGAVHLNEAGERHFTITGHADLQEQLTLSGQADLAERTISLNAFEPDDEPLKLILMPTNESLEFAAWPPMTNLVDIEVQMHGANLLMQTSGTLQQGNITADVEFEAIKDIDLPSLLRSIASVC